MEILEKLQSKWRDELKSSLNLDCEKIYLDTLIEIEDASRLAVCKGYESFIPSFFTAELTGKTGQLVSVNPDGKICHWTENY